MITLAYIVIIILFCFISFLKEKTVFCMPFLFTILWGCGGIFIANWDKLYTIDVYVHLYILISIIFFNIGYILTYKKQRMFFEPSWNLDEKKFNLLLISHIICYILIIPVFIYALRIISTVGLSAVRTMAYGESEMMSSLVFKIYSWFITPIFTTTGLIAMILFFTKYKHKKMLLSLGLIDMILVTLSFGGRYALVRIAVFFLAALILRRHLLRDKRRIPVKYFILGGVTVLCLYLMTSNRSIGDLNFVENILVYFYGSFAYFNILTSNPIYTSVHPIPLFGNETLGFITSLPQLFLYKLTNVNNTPEFLQDLASNDFLYIGPDVKYNALATVLYPMWLDGRLVGIILGMLFLGIMFNVLKNLTLKKNSMTLYALLIYFIFVLSTSTLTYGLITVQHSITLLFIIFFTNKSSNYKSYV